MKIYRDILTALKGFFMGAANVVPGVSGGTIALISGIYAEILAALDAVMSVDTWRDLIGKGEFKVRLTTWWQRIHGRFLLSLGIGMVVSIFSLAKLMAWLLANCPVQTWAFFFGLIVASAAFMLRDIKGWKALDVILVIAGIALGVAVCSLTPTNTPDALWFVFICGAVAICTMILPGISGSFILVVLGKYDYIMSAVSSLDIPVLAVFALGCLLGILAFAKFLNWLLGRWEKQTMLILVGFVIGSLIKVWPWANMEAIAASQGLPAGSEAIDMHIAGAVIWCLVGIALIVTIELLSKKSNK